MTGRQRPDTSRGGVRVAEVLELELELGVDGHGAFVVAARSPAGEESGQLLLDPDAVLGQRAQLQSTVLASAVTSRRALSEVEGPVRKVGELLFQSLFNGKLYGAYKASVALTQQQGLPLRVVLRTHVPELAALPWEMLYDSEAGAYLCQRDPLVRHVSVSAPSRPLDVQPPLRVLGLVSAPADQQRLDVAGEKSRLGDALDELGRLVELRWVDGGSWGDLQSELVSGSWHVLHFVGHGGFDSARQEGVLALEGADGRSDLVGADRFSQLLTTQVPPPQLVVLNSCAGAQAAADDLFSSTAASLVRAGVSASVAMQFAVSDPAAKAFAAGFYQAIAHNHSVADAVRIGRIGIRGTSEDTLEWVTPALYLRGDDAPLFTVVPATGPADDDAGPTPEQAASHAAARALYQQAMSHFRRERYGDAVALFDSLLSLVPDYQDAVARRDEAAARQRAAESYDAGRRAEDRGDWTAAIAGFDETLRLLPDHPDARRRREQCAHRLRVAGLTDELRQHAAAEDWEAAVAVAEELDRVDPGAADPDGLATKAREAVRTPAAGENVRDEPAPGGGTRAHSDPPAVDAVAAPGQASASGAGAPDLPAAGDGETSPRRRYTIIAAAGVAVLLVATLVTVLVNRGDSAPAPFKSAALFGFAKNLFSSDECKVPTPAEAPLATSVRHTEVVQCTRTASPQFTAAFFCTNNLSDLEDARAAFLNNAEPNSRRRITTPPAGQSTVVDGVQTAFTHVGSHAARVYWDSPRLLCAGELQGPNSDVNAAIDYWVKGRSAF
jgi:tetratricopeptide (TPR) repeat protein